MSELSHVSSGCSNLILIKTPTWITRYCKATQQPCLGFELHSWVQLFSAEDNCIALAKTLNNEN